MAHDIESRLAVCSWSLQPDTPEELVAHLREIGIPRVQLALDPLRENPDAWGKTAVLLDAEGIEIVSGMFGTIGEDYSSLDAIRESGGVVPDEHWDANWANIQAVASIAAGLGLKIVTFHAGFLPHEESDPGFAKLLGRITQIADVFDANGIELGSKPGRKPPARCGSSSRNSTGQASASTSTRRTCCSTARAIQSTRSRRSRRSSSSATSRMPPSPRSPALGAPRSPSAPARSIGRRFFAILAKVGFEGDCCIEREADDQRVADIRTAREFVTQL